jgi:hypothetical protein
MDAVECSEEGGNVGWVDGDFDLEGGCGGWKVQVGFVMLE